MADHKSFRLRYVGPRFAGVRLPVDVLSDLAAFRDLLVSYAREGWRAANLQRKRLPKGFDKSIAFDLVAIDEGSAVPKLDWNREAAQAVLPGFTVELEVLVNQSYEKLLSLIDGAGNDKFPPVLSSEHIRALNRLGSGLREDERIEFLGSQGANGNVVYLDTYRRKKLITHLRDTYQSRFEGSGQLLGAHVDTAANSGWIYVSTEEYGEIRIPLDPDRIVKEFDGNILAEVQFRLQIELDNNDNWRNVIEVFDVEIIDEAIEDSLMRCRKRLEELGKLPPGWRDGVGEAVSPVTLETAQRFLAKRPTLAGSYRIYPTEAGGLLFEFEISGWDLSVEFGEDGAVEMYGVQIDGADEMEARRFDKLNDDFVNLFDSRVGR